MPEDKPELPLDKQYSTWIKPSKVEVQVNKLPANEAKAKELGWKLKK